MPSEHAASGDVLAFEHIEPPYPYLPLAARRALDHLGKKLSLEGWLSLAEEDRAAFVRLGAAEVVDLAAAEEIVARARIPAADVAKVGDPDPNEPPSSLLAALGPHRPITGKRWASLRALERYALVKSAGKQEKLAAAYDAIVGRAEARPLTHVNAAGEAHMVDVGEKAPTRRRAVASARVIMRPDVRALVTSGALPKGDVFAVARVAGIQAAKRTPELIPLCHTVALTRVEIAFETPADDPGVVTIRSSVEAYDRTGVEMEALVAASNAALTLYDMIKAADRWVVISDLRLDEKSGGRSGTLTRPRE